MRKLRSCLMALCSMMMLGSCGTTGPGTTPSVSDTKDPVSETFVPESSTEISIPEKVTMTFEQYDIVIKTRTDEDGYQYKVYYFGKELYATYTMDFEYGHVMTENEISNLTRRDMLNLQLPDYDTGIQFYYITLFYLNKHLALCEETQLKAGTELVQDMTIYFSIYY